MSTWKSYFASTAISADETGSSSNTHLEDREQWMQESANIKGVNVYAYGLISGFGENNAFSQYVSQCLINRLIRSSELERIVNELNLLQSNDNIRIIDDQVIALLKSVFISLNADYFEQYEMQATHLSDEKPSLKDVDSPSFCPSNTSGCSAAVTLIINNRLFVANLGNSTAVLCKQLSDQDDMYLFQLTALHEDVNNTTGINSLPTKFFGRRTSKSLDTDTEMCEPFVVGQSIPIDQAISFLLFVSPFAVKIATLKNLDNLDNVNTYLVTLILNDLKVTGSIEKTLKNVINKLLEHYDEMSRPAAQKPVIALGYVDLHNDCETDCVFDSQDAIGSDQVQSEVDWSELETHELRDVFTATINSLRANRHT